MTKITLTRLFKLGIVLGLAYYALIVLGSFIATKSPQNLEPADVIIVHGAGGKENTLMEPSIRRAQKAAEAYHAGLAPLLIFTGAADKPENRAVSQMMAEIAMSNGVPAEAIRFEDRSFSTIANLENAQALLGGYPERIILISHGFHLPRAWTIAKWQGANDVQLLSTDRIYHPLFPNGIYILLREGLAWPSNLARLIWSNV